MIILSLSILSCVGLISRIIVLIEEVSDVVDVPVRLIFYRAIVGRIGVVACETNCCWEV